MATLRDLVPIAIMSGRNPMGTPRGIDPNLEERVRHFHADYGALPALVLVPQELRPREPLSWSAYLALADGFGTSWPNIPADPGIPKTGRRQGVLSAGDTSRWYGSE